MVFNRNIKPPENVNIPEFQPKGIEAGFWILDRELRKKDEAKILVYYDPDIDGLMAGLLVEHYLDQLGLGSKLKNYKFYLNSNRQHGFKITDEDLEDLVGYTIIAVDFSITGEDFKKLLNAGINVVNIDHHEINISEYTDSDKEIVCLRNGESYGVIINNQYDCEPEEFRFLSGAGMVYYFLKYVSKQYKVPVEVDAPAMVGITLLSDIRELESKEARSFLKYTYTLNSDYMKYLQWLTKSENYISQRFSPFGVPCISRDFIDFTFSPVINALLRADKGYEAIDLLRGVDDTVAKLKYKDKLFRFRDDQKKIIASIMKEVKENENASLGLVRRYSNLMVCCLPQSFVPVEGYNITNYVGVACSKIKDEDKTGVILVVDDHNMVVRGSVRGGQDDVEYLELFQKNGVPSAGHHNAFGILSCDYTKINFDKISQEIEEVEKEALARRSNTRSVLEVNNLNAFSKSPILKKICVYNALSRDNHRIYLKYLGNVLDKTKVRMDIVSEKYIKYQIDGVQIHCYDSELNLSDAIILPSLENNKYVRYTLRVGFDYDTSVDSAEVYRKLSEV